MVQRISLLSYPPLFQRATNSLICQQYTKAQSEFRKCLEVNPSSYSSYLNLAYIAHLKQDYASAIQLCDVAINMKPYCSQAYYNRCLTLLKLGSSNLVDASEDINAALSCMYLQKFKLTGKVQFLQTAISYCENNLQALRLIIICGNKKAKKIYLQLLAKHEDRYCISGQVQKVKLYACAQQGLFRLKSTTFQYKLSEIKNKIGLYLALLSSQAQNQQLFETQPRLSLATQTFALKIQPNNLNNRLTFDQVNIRQLRRHSATIDPLREIQNFSLTVPNSSSRYSLIDSIKSINNHSVCDSVNSSTKSCHHGCLKCKKQSQQFIAIPSDAIKMSIKTVEIFRNENILQPKPYLIVYDGQNSYVTDVDYSGGFFPTFNNIFHLNRNSQAPYRIELWNKGQKQRQDCLIGTASFEGKQGRFKCYFIKHYGGSKRTGYVFLSLSK